MLRTLVCAISVVWAMSAHAQQDSLVVDDTGFVGIGTTLPDETVQVVAAIEAPVVQLAARCQRDIPVRIVITDALTGDTLLVEQAFLSQTSRLLTATLPPNGESGETVQVAVLTHRRLTGCVTAEATAIGPLGIRRLDR